jgi:hypothetical protein
MDIRSLAWVHAFAYGNSVRARKSENNEIDFYGLAVASRSSPIGDAVGCSGKEAFEHEVGALVLFGPAVGLFIRRRPLQTVFLPWGDAGQRRPADYNTPI